MAPDILEHARGEAERIRRTIIPALHEGLQPLALNVLDVGLEVKRALISVRRRREVDLERFEGERSRARDGLRAFVDGFSPVMCAGSGEDGARGSRAGDIRAAFEEYGSAIKRCNRGLVDAEKGFDSSPEGERLRLALEVKYRDAVIVDEKAEELKEERVSWDIRYFATLELDEESGKTMVSVNVGTEDEGASGTVDKCCVCGLVFRPGDARVRCFDCADAVACLTCHKSAKALYDKIGASKQNEAVLEELLACCPHLRHLSAEEDDVPSELWNRMMKTREQSASGNNASDSTMRKLLPRIFAEYANRPCFGMPAKDQPGLLQENEVGCTASISPIQYKWFTYSEVWNNVSLLATHLIDVLPFPPPPLRRSPNGGAEEPRAMPEIGIFSSPTPTFFTLELACVALGRVCVSTDTSWRVRDVLSAMDAAGVTTLLLDVAGFLELAKSLMKVKDKGAKGTDADVNGICLVMPKSVGHIIVVGSDPFEESSLDDADRPLASFMEGWASYAGIQLDFVLTQLSQRHDINQTQCSIAELAKYTSSHHDVMLPGDEFVLGLFSSGTSASGYKGILLREKSFRKDITYTKTDYAIRLGHPIVAALDCSPAWGSGLDTCWKNICVGGRIGFATIRPPGTPIWPYLAGIQPTWFASLVPAQASSLLEGHEKFVEQNLPKVVNESKQLQLEALTYAKAAEYLYSCLGGRIEIIGVGGAMVNQSHVSKLTKILPCRIVQTYGSSEGSGMGEGRHGEDTIKIESTTQFRVESRPELGFTLEDMPYPRGELLIHSDIMSRAEDWFGSDATVSLQRGKYATDGYYCTGDIVELHRDRNTIRIIDRAKCKQRRFNFSPENASCG